MNTLLRSVLSAAAIAPALLVPAVSGQDGYSSAGMSRSRYLAQYGRLPAADEVVVEELLNYHRHDVPLPRAGEAVALDLRFDRAAVNAPGGTVALQVGLATTRVLDRASLPPQNLAIVVDVSGSMDEADKLGCVKRSLLALLDQLRPDDRIALVSYSTTAQVVLPSAPLGDRRAARCAVERLRADGWTNLHAGLMLGYEEAARGRRCEPDATNRVILLTDGHANRGVIEPTAIARDSAGWNDRGVDLSTIGVGMSLQNDLLRELAETGRGLYHFVASAEDIDKVFVREVQGLVGPLCRDVRLEIDGGSDLELTRVFGYAPRRTGGGRVVFDLPDLNLGLTQVVLVECTLREPAPSRRMTEPVRARLSWFDERRGESRSCTAELELRMMSRGRTPAVAAPDVVKNHTIAKLATAIRAAVSQAERGRTLESRRVVDNALARAELTFPNREDADVERVRDLALSVQEILAARLEHGDDEGSRRRGRVAR